MRIVFLILILFASGCDPAKRLQREEAKAEKRATADANKVLESERVTNKVVKGYLNRNPFDDSIVLKKSIPVHTQRIIFDTTINIKGEKTVTEKHYYHTSQVDTVTHFDRSIERTQQAFMMEMERRFAKFSDSTKAVISILMIERDQFKDKAKSAKSLLLVWQIATALIILALLFGPTILKRLNPLNRLKIF